MENCFILQGNLGFSALRRELQDAGWMEADPPEAPEEDLDWLNDLDMDMQEVLQEVMNQMTAQHNEAQMTAQHSPSFDEMILKDTSVGS